MDFACSDNINHYIQFIGGDVPDELMNSVLISADNYIESCLKAESIPLPNEVPPILVQAANYYAINDLLAIVELDNDTSVDNSFLKKADTFIKNYIKSVRKSDAGVSIDLYVDRDYY